MAHPPARSPVVLAADVSPDDASHTASSTSLVTHPDYSGWTPARQATFLRALASSLSVSQAAKAAGMGRQSAYKLRALMKGEPFDLAWAAALRGPLVARVDIALDRAMYGVEVPHLYMGEGVHTSRRYDERLTVALLAMSEKLAPEPRLPRRYREGASDYGPDAFPTLVALIEAGETTWEAVEEREREEYYAELDALEREDAEDESEGS